MNKRKLILIAVAMLYLWSVSSCKKDDDNPPSGVVPTSEFVFSADINGTPWKAETDTINFFIASPDCGLAYGTGSGNGTELYLHMEGPISAGIGFPLNQNGNNYLEMHNGFDYFTSTSGMATITEFNSTTRSITITFTATLDNGGGNLIQITNGLMKKRPYFGPYSTNSIIANINGNPVTGICAPTSVNDIGDNSILTFSNNPQTDNFFALIVPNTCVAGDSFRVGDMVIGTSIFDWTTGSCPGNTCNYTFTLTDSYGDGWNGAEMEIRQGSNLVATLGSNFINGYTSNHVISLQSNKNYSIVFTNGGMYPSEIGVAVIDQNGTTLFNSEDNNGADMMFSLGPYDDYDGHGLITITSHNTGTNKISGSFSYQGVDDLGNPFLMDGGSFSVTYQDFLYVKKPDAEKSIHKLISGSKNNKEVFERNDKHRKRK